MNGLARLWRLLTEAPTAVSESGRRRQIQLLSGLLVVLIPLVLLLIGVQLLLFQGFWSTFVAVASALVVLLFAYGLARIGKFTVGALLTVGTSALTCFVVVTLNPHDPIVYAFLNVSMFLARLLFDKTGVWITTLANLLGVTLLLPVFGVPPPGDDPVVVPVFLIITAAMLLFGIRYRDAVERDRQMELVASEVRFRDFADATLEGVVFTENGSIIDINERGAALVGATSSAALIGRNILDFCVPADRERVATLMRNNVTTPYEFTIRRVDGSEFPGVVRGRTSLYHNRPVRVTVFRDLTERRRAEQALRDSEARYRSIVETAQEGIWQIDANGRTSYVNRKMAEILGYTVAEMQGRSLLDFMDIEGRAIASYNIERRKQGIAEQHEFKFQHKDGATVWAELNTTPQHNADGSYAGALAMVTDITERRRAEMALRESEAKYRQLFENMTSGFALHEIICDAEGKPVDYRYLQANPAFEKLTGVPIANLVGKRIREIMPDTEDYWIQIFGKVALTRESMAYENFSRELGKYYDTWAFSPQENQFAVIFTDITKRKLAEAEMLKLSSALEQTADSVIITDRNGVIEYVNPGFEKTTGYSRDEALGQTPRLVKSGKQGAGFYKKLWNTILAGDVFSEVFVNRRKDGGLYYEEKTISPLKGPAGQVTHFVATGKDVTERMQTQERLQHMAQHDALTELPNRALFLDRLKQALARARWHKRLVAVLFVDMDRFKTINDTLGHEIGDKLLQALAERFSVSVREGDTVARFGGDEFVVLLDDVASEKDIGALAQKVIEMLAPPFEIGGQSLYITASIGVSLYPNDGEDSTTLLKNADIAMYRAKDLGKNTYQFYSADMSARAFERLTLESSLRHAIERNEFRLYYQPQIDSASGAILGVEALLRWQHPDFGLVAPAEFIPLLEETGLIVPVGDWVFRTACEQLCAWHAAGWPTLRMAVNLSPRQFQAAGLAIMVERGLATVGCDPGLIELEITENVLLRHAAATLDALDALRTLGVRLAIDDFGTGYSSLSYLRRYAIDTLKIDRSFVHDVPGDPDDSAIASAIIVMAQSLKLDVIAEGVETEAQRDFLRERGCHLMQGYLFSRPLPAEEIPRLLETRNPKG